MAINRNRYFDLISLNFSVHPICAILGSRFSDKMMFANDYAEKEFLHNFYRFDLTNPLDMASLENFELAMTLLQNIDQQLIIINDIQLKPEIFSLLRVLVDQTRTVPGRAIAKMQKFLILGDSALHDFLHLSAQRLVGRIGYVELPDGIKYNVYN